MEETNTSNNLLETHDYRINNVISNDEKCLYNEKVLFKYFTDKILIYVYDVEDVYLIVLSKKSTLSDLYREVYLQNPNLTDIYNLYYKTPTSNRNILEISERKLQDILVNEIEIITNLPNKRIYKMYIEKNDPINYLEHFSLINSPNYIKSDNYIGSKKCYVFKTGPLGLGYYKDSLSWGEYIWMYNLSYK